MSRVEEDEWLEWVVEAEFVKELEEAGWLTVKGDKVKRGYPDQFCFGPDEQVVIVEFKRNKARKNRRGEKLQKYYRDQFRGLGFTVHTVRGKEQADELRRSLLSEGSSV